MIKQRKISSIEQRREKQRERYWKDRDKIIARQKINRAYRKLKEKEIKEMSPEELLDMVGYE